MQDQLSVFVAFLGGTFSFLSPCVLPLFPSYLSFITGMSVEELSDTQSKTLKPILQNSLLFVLVSHWSSSPWALPQGFWEAPY
jgi:cytochrome c-type biogenesis protein